MQLLFSPGPRKTGDADMAEDNDDQAREMALEGQQKLKQGKAKDETEAGRELIEEAKRLDHDAIADIAPESEDAKRGER
jgi:hypothetical protein